MPYFAKPMVGKTQGSIYDFFDALELKGAEIVGVTDDKVLPVFRYRMDGFQNPTLLIRTQEEQLYLFNQGRHGTPGQRQVPVHLFWTLEHVRRRYANAQLLRPNGLPFLKVDGLWRLSDEAIAGRLRFDSIDQKMKFHQEGTIDDLLHNAKVYASTGYLPDYLQRRYSGQQGDWNPTEEGKKIAREILTTALCPSFEIARSA